jgi:2-amino-4-hydroxy-6-hydroxymethyldihydropteridine diphosphokinase
MAPSHRYFLSLGSNVQPEENLARAIRHLREHGKVEAISSIWESQAVGSSGPNFLNLCLSIVSPLEHSQFKESVARDVESRMGRQRGSDRSAPRTIDIDVLMVDDAPVNPERWRHPFVIMPLAELLPHFPHPIDHEPLSQVAQKRRAETWIVPRAGVLPEGKP